MNGVSLLVARKQGRALVWPQMKWFWHRFWRLPWVGFDGGPMHVLIRVFLHILESEPWWTSPWLRCSVPPATAADHERISKSCLDRLRVWA